MDEKQKLENSIMDKIGSGRVKLRSKYVFLAEKLGLGTAFALSVTLAVLFFNLLLFYLKETDNLKYLSFGRFGFLAFLESFPYLLVIAFIIFIIMAGYLLAKSDASYKKPFGLLAVGLIIFIMIAGGVLTYTEIAKKMEAEAYLGRHPAGTFFKFFVGGGTETRRLGIAGMVFEVGDNYLIIETPQGLRNIELKEGVSSQAEKGQFVIAIGNNEGQDFVAKEIRTMEKGEAPMIERGIDRRFKPFSGQEVKSLPPHLFLFEEEKKDCVKKCFDSGIDPRECFDQCMR
jgi:hypothetical protein